MISIIFYIVPFQENPVNLSVLYIKTTLKFAVTKYLVFARTMSFGVVIYQKAVWYGGQDKKQNLVFQGLLFFCV